MTRREIKDAALSQIARAQFGWDTDNAVDMSDEVAAKIVAAMEAAYEAGRRAPRSSITGKYAG